METQVLPSETRLCNACRAQGLNDGPLQDFVPCRGGVAPSPEGQSHCVGDVRHARSPVLTRAAWRGLRRRRQIIITVNSIASRKGSTHFEWMAEAEFAQGVTP